MKDHMHPECGAGPGLCPIESHNHRVMPCGATHDHLGHKHRLPGSPTVDRWCKGTVAAYRNWLEGLLSRHSACRRNPDLYDPRGRTLDEVRHKIEVGPLDRADWPSVGDEVLYHHPRDGWKSAIVLDVAAHDGDLCLDYGDGPDLAALDVKHGPHRHGWLHYGEAASRD